MNYRETMSRLNSALGTIDSAYGVIAKKYGLSFNSLMVVYLIYESDTITQKLICDTLHLPKSTVHSILLDFMKQEYIVLKTGNNKKEKFVKFTKLGVKHFGVVLEETQKFEDKILSALGANTCIFLVETAEKLGSIINDEIAELSNREV